jgi:hypothetical protein
MPRKLRSKRDPVDDLLRDDGDDGYNAWQERLNGDYMQEREPYSDLYTTGAGEQADKLLVAVIVLLIALVVYLFIFYKGGITGAKKAPTTPATPAKPAAPAHRIGGSGTLPRPKPAHFTSQAADDSCGAPLPTPVPGEHIEHRRQRAHFSPGAEKIKGPSRHREFGDATCGSDLGDLSGYTN